MLTDKSGKPGSDFYAAFTATPMANDLEVELAKAAVVAENLGQREVTDVLALSFTANDVIGHAFGPESHEVQDAAVRVDRSIAVLVPSPVPPRVVGPTRLENLTESS